MANKVVGPIVAAQAAYRAGFRGNGLLMAVAIAIAESGSDALALSPPNKDQWGSRDRGLWQINDHWHPEVTDACAYDVNCAAQAAFKISNGGTNWHPWSTYTNGAYRQYLPAAQLAVQTVQANPNVDPNDPSQGDPGAVGSDPGPLNSPVPLPGQPGFPKVPGLSTIGDAIAVLGRAAAWTANRQNWVRVLEIMLGGVGLVVALTMLSRDLWEPAAGTAATAAAL